MSAYITWNGWQGTYNQLRIVLENTDSPDCYLVLSTAGDWDDETEKSNNGDKRRKHEHVDSGCGVRWLIKSGESPKSAGGEARMS